MFLGLPRLPLPSVGAHKLSKASSYLLFFGMMFVNNGDEGMIIVLTSLLLYIYTGTVYTNVLTVGSNFCFFCVIIYVCIFMCAHLSQRRYDDIFRKVLLNRSIDTAWTI